ncbi:CHRD domain-containing protein [Streptomyces sp. 549]|uniref:CHRD domain-containing protein n=1 Tax=Streptomyces sp. 549 TaxID=3049076 RepID=UPI0024C4223C|nr:CHRD domain-containing protein [Streptomyces sp. 549]MDK1472602.1 CHRD domain-containing protein [Streptomyces sp. 549]
MRRRFLALSAAALALGLLGTSPASAHTSHGSSTVPTTTTTTKPAKGKSVSLAAVLTGAQEVSEDGKRGAGDPDGKAIALVNVKGDRVTFALKWKGIEAPAAGHIHIGGLGKNGDVAVPLFGTPMPKTVRAAAGHVSVEDAKIAKAIIAKPHGFYVNLHNKKFPDGAVRGQLKPIKKAINPLEIIKAGKLRALASGFQEISSEGVPLAGDLDGFGIGFVDPRHNKAHYSLAWVNIGAPQAAHVHEGGFGKNGDVRFPLFTTPIPENIFAVSGVVNKLNPAGLKHIAANANGFYLNVHNKEFPDGAVRGQLSH